MYSIRANAENSSQFTSRVEKFISSGTELTDPNIELLWKAAPISSSSPSKERGTFDKQFNFSPFTFQLNELHEYMRNPTRVLLKSDKHETEMSLGPLPPTDSRLRPDLRLYESGKVDEASAEKHRLEEKQREAAKKSDAGEMEKWNPLWFEKADEATTATSQDETTTNKNYNQGWVFKNTYWNREFSKCPDIY